MWRNGGAGTVQFIQIIPEFTIIYRFTAKTAERHIVIRILKKSIFLQKELGFFVTEVIIKERTFNGIVTENVL